MTDDLLTALSAIHDRAETAINGRGHRPWSAEYVMEIVREIRDLAHQAQRAAAAEEEG